MEQLLKIKKHREEIDILITLNPIFSLLMKNHKWVLSGDWILSYQDMGMGGPDFHLEGVNHSAGEIKFSGDREFPKLLSQDIYFDHGILRREDSQFLIGIEDSDYIFVKGPIEVLKDIASIFDNSEFILEKCSK